MGHPPFDGGRPLRALGAHRLSTGDLDSLALGSLDSGIIRRLARSEISRRRIAFRAVLDLLREQHPRLGPLLPVDEVWDLLVEIERQDAAAARAVLDRPLAGAWAARLLRRLRGLTQEDVPLWVEVGHLHAMAAAAAVRAGSSIELRVPLRRGFVHLPAVGHARLGSPEPWDTAVVRTVAAEIDVVGPTRRIRLRRDEQDFRVVRPAGDPPGGTGAPAPDDGSWWPVHVAGPVGLVVEDCDPYRMSGRAAEPHRLPPARTDRWGRLLADSAAVARAGHPDLAAGVDAVISAVVPLPAAARFRSYSSTSGDAIGSVEMSEPHDALDGAAMLAHELRHAVLGMLLHVVGDLVDPAAPVRPRYAPWRDDPRPPRGMLHGVYAFFGVADFWRVQRGLSVGDDAMLGHFEFALWRAAVCDTAADLLRDPALSAIGRRFLTGLLTTAQAWLSEPVPFEAARLAALVTADTRALWRAHHLRPAPAAVERLADAWLTGGEPDAVTVPTRQVPDRDARALDTRAGLARLWLSDRDELRRIERDGPGCGYRHASRADCALVAGDLVTARARYEARLVDVADDRRALVGLGLALRDDTAAGRVLRERPELVYAVAVAVAVARAGRRPDPGALAGWLAPVTDTDTDTDTDTADEPAHGEADERLAVPPARSA
ncbi:HEXXH motif domain-containing protein [Frankia sp. CiP3]|uniref:HEXXH motif domain-containing protein n=1 Tax=Frankia sp. CiP3 TaxID=2880971 RepID=UPI001EF41BB7|nr:HEXXH motif domain-containing protein [Frankia sp. CiP3]